MEGSASTKLAGDRFGRSPLAEPGESGRLGIVKRL